MDNRTHPEDEKEERSSFVLSMRVKATIFGVAFISSMLVTAVWGLPHLVVALQDLGLGDHDGVGDYDPTDSRYEPVLIWSRTYSSGCPGLIVEATQGEYCITGERCRQIVSPDDPETTLQDWDIYIASIEEDGAPIWEQTLGRKTFDPNQTEERIQEWMIWEGTRDVIPTKDGFIVLAWGYDVIPDAPPIVAHQLNTYLYSIDDQGNELWRRAYGGDLWDNPVNIVESPDGGYLVGGNRFTVKNSWESGESMWYDGVEYTDIFLLKLDQNGEVIWERTYDKAGTSWIGLRDSTYSWSEYYNSFSGMGLAERSPSIIPSNDGGYIVAGTTSPFYLMRPGDTPNIYLLKIDNDGETTWEREYESSDYYSATSIVHTGDGGYLIAGERMMPGRVIVIPKGLHKGEEYLEPGEKYTYFMKTDREGNQIWNRTLWLGGVVKDLAPTPEGDFIGIARKAAFKLDSKGNLLWDWMFPDIDGEPGRVSSIKLLGGKDFLGMGWKSSGDASGPCGTSLYAFKVTLDGGSGE